jgi:hypothetical protein
LSFYVIHKCEGLSISMNSGNVGKTVHFELRHIDEESNPEGLRLAAVRSNSYWASDPPRSINGLRLSVARQAKAYESYLERTGKRWEVEQRDKLIAELAVKKRTKRIEWLRRNIPILQAELDAFEAEEKSRVGA